MRNLTQLRSYGNFILPTLLLATASQSQTQVAEKHHHDTACLCHSLTVSTPSRRPKIKKTTRTEKEKD